MAWNRPRDRIPFPYCNHSRYSRTYTLSYDYFRPPYTIDKMKILYIGVSAPNDISLRQGPPLTIANRSSRTSRSRRWNYALSEI